ncbi:probable O-methyltransferase 3 [Solanum verrucosum]|uniref:probable O-methyltransferase 3 n=1 Tax=Solanum verrucosum TaxID=315347 RepID=UPI0020D19BD6|nr:probable O-methyltransferase 3 [Solanum verrucosum]
MALPNGDIGDETREVLAAQAHIWNHTFNFISTMSLKCAIQLDEKEGYLLTPSSRLLFKDETNNLSMIPFIQMILDPVMMDPWHDLSQWIQYGGDDQPSPFATTHDLSE